MTNINNEENNVEESVLDIVVEIARLFDKLDEINDSIPDKHSSYDLKISDLYHTLEDMPLDSTRCYRFCKELKQVLQERRKFKIEQGVMQKFQEQRNKIISDKGNRDILLSKLGMEKKKLSYPYNYRIYAQSEIDNILNIKRENYSEEKK